MVKESNFNKNSGKIQLPLISVVMAAYNTEKYIAQAIESILNQTFKEFEFIIIDDASTDNTWKIISKFADQDKRIRAFQNKTNQKVSYSSNKGIGKARGKYIARIDSDDWSYPYRLKLQFDFMEKNPDVGISGGIMEICDTRLRPIVQRRYDSTDKQIRKSIFYYSPFSHPLVIIRKSILLKTSLYNKKYFPAEDYELYFKIGLLSKFANMNEVLLKYRVIDDSLTTGQTKLMELNTLKARWKYIKNRSYKIGLFAILYNLIEYISIYLIPNKIKLRIYFLIRNTRLKS